MNTGQTAFAIPEWEGEVSKNLQFLKRTAAVKKDRATTSNNSLGDCYDEFKKGGEGRREKGRMF